MRSRVWGFLRRRALLLSSAGGREPELAEFLRGTVQVSAVFLVCVCFLMRWNSRELTIRKGPVLGHWMPSRNVRPAILSVSGAFSSPQKETLSPGVAVPQAPPRASGTQESLCVSQDRSHLNISCKKNHTVRGLRCLAYVTERRVWGTVHIAARVGTLFLFTAA